MLDLDINQLISVAKCFFFFEYEQHIDNKINIYKTKEEHLSSEHHKNGYSSGTELSSYNINDREIHIFLFNLNYVGDNNVTKIAFIGSLFECFYHCISSEQNETIYNLKRYYDDTENREFEINGAKRCCKRMFTNHLENIRRIIKINEEVTVEMTEDNMFINFESGYEITFAI